MRGSEMMLTAKWWFVVAVRTVGHLITDLRSVDAVVSSTWTLPLVKATRRHWRYTATQHNSQCWVNYFLKVINYNYLLLMYKSN